MLDIFEYFKRELKAPKEKITKKEIRNIEIKLGL